MAESAAIQSLNNSFHYENTELYCENIPISLITVSSPTNPLAFKIISLPLKI